MYAEISLPQLNLLESMQTCFKNYFKFSGRARRSEFWYFYVITRGLAIIFFSISLSYTHYEESHPYSNVTVIRRVPDSNTYYVFFSIFLVIELVTIIPYLAVSTRRLHDIGRTGWYNFLLIVPFGVCCLWCLWGRDSDIGVNIFGPPTKYNYNANGPFMDNTLGIQPIVPPPMYPQQNMIAQPNIYPGEPINNAQPQANNFQGQNIPVAQPNFYQGAPNNQIQQQPNDFQGQDIPVGQPNMALDVNPQEQTPNMYPKPS